LKVRLLVFFGLSHVQLAEALKLSEKLGSASLWHFAYIIIYTRP
jgi:hypothetical protein